MEKIFDVPLSSELKFMERLTRREKAAVVGVWRPWRAGAAGAACRCGRAALPAAAPAAPRRRAAAPLGSVSRASPPTPPHRPRRARRRYGALHRDRAQVPVLVEYHRHRVPRPGAEGRGLGRGHEGDGPVVSKRSQVEVEKTARQLPRRTQETKRDVGEGPRQSRQEELPLEVHGADAVPAAVHEQQEEADGLAQLPRACRGAGERPARALQLRIRVGSGVGAQAQELAAHRHRPQAGLPVQGARRQARLPRARARRARRAPARAPRPARHLLQQHVPVHQALSLPHADQDKEELVQRGDRGGGGAAGGAGELRQPVGAGGGLVVQQRAQRRRAQAVLSPAPPPGRAARAPAGAAGRLTLPTT